MQRGILLGVFLCAAAGSARAGDQQRSVPDGALPGPTSATGVEQKPRRGVFAEATLGLFTTLGGSRFFSNGQPYLGMMVGTEIGEAASVFGSIGIGASSASCFDLDTRGNCRAADSFGATYLEVGASYGAPIGPRLLLSGKLVAGLTNLSPGPVLDSGTRAVPDNLFGFHGGVGLALDYDTHLDHFAIGIDTLLRYTMTSAQRSDGTKLAVASLAFMPRLRYVF
jgi:hypothetical protein